MSDIGSSEGHGDTTNNEDFSLDLSLSIGSTAKRATTLTPLSSSSTPLSITLACQPSPSSWPPTTLDWQPSSSSLPTTSAWQPPPSCLPTTSAWQSSSSCLPTTSACQSSSSCLPTTSACQSYSSSSSSSSSVLRKRLAWQAKPRRLHCTGKRKQGSSKGKPDELMTPPFRWATDRPAVVHNLMYLIDAGILSISGEVKCKRCDNSFEIEYDLRSKFMEIVSYIIAKMDSMRDRAPEEWMNPRLPDCKVCGEHSCAKPVIPENNSQINWLFLLLGQLLGCCTLSQLRYFCEHNGKHRTGAKNRVLYSTYLTICKQLNNTLPFDVA